MKHLKLQTVIPILSHSLILGGYPSDDENQGVNNVLLLQDKAEEYSFIQLEDALKNADHWDEYRDRINALGIDNPADVTNLFNSWPQ